VLGPIDLFNDPPLIKMNEFEVTSSSLTTDMGSVLRMPFHAYYKHVYIKRRPVVKKIIPVNHGDPDLLTDDQVAKMSPEDMEVFRLRKLARTLIPSEVFKAMLTYELIGSRQADRGASYITRTEYGRIIPLSENEMHTVGYGMVYIVLSGQIQLRLSTSQQRAGKKFGTIGCAKNVDNDLELKVCVLLE
jgi:hypothetical protein